MIYAIVDGQRVSPMPGARGVCPLCRAECLAKCGSINAWHWAHRSLADCDTWSEGETSWHLGWKARAKPEEVEVSMPPHRADIRRADGYVIELQHSPISPEEIAEREAFYRRMVWLFDGRSFAERFDLRPKGDYYTFRWKHPRRSIFAARRPVFIDFGPHIFEVKRLHAETPCGGWGFLHTAAAWIARAKLRALSPEEARRIALVTVFAVSPQMIGSYSGRFESVVEARRYVDRIVSSHETVTVRVRAWHADGSEVERFDLGGRLEACTS